MTNIKEAGDNIYEMTLKASDIRLDIMNKKRELQETVLYKEIQELEAMERDCSALAKVYEDNVKQQMQDAGLKSMEFTHQKVTLKKSGGSVVVEEESDIPKEYIKEKVMTSVDKTALKK